MSDVSKFKIGTTEISVKDSTARSGVATNSNNIGTLSNLTTTVKTNLVAAINEIDGSMISPTYDSGTETITLS